nr:pentatricopeptide repeat protein AaPPR7 [Agave angustifolia]
MATTGIVLGSSPPQPPKPSVSPSPLTIKTNLFFSSTAKTKPLSHTLAIFPLLPLRDTVTWNTALSACLRHRRPLDALHLFLDMLLSSSPPDSITLRSVLRACLQHDNCMLLAPQLHAYMLKMQSVLFSASELTVVSTCLLNVYLSCGCIDLARKVFVTIPERDVVACTSMLKGFAEAGENEEAFRVFKDMVEGENLMINEHAYSCALHACAGTCCLFGGQQIHARVVKSVMGSDVFVGTGLVDLYVKCNEMECARKAFAEIVEPGVVSYNALLAGNLEGDEGLRLFSELRLLGMDPDHVTFASVLRACKDVSIYSVKQLHGLVVKMMEAELDVFLSCALFEAYIDLGCFDEAQKVFGRIEDKDNAAFNLAIQGYLRNGHETEALESLIQALKMRKEVREVNATSLLVNSADWIRGSSCML